MSMSGNNAEGAICAICLTAHHGRVYLSPCFHSFCAACIAAWLDLSIVCPLCKTQPTKIHWGVNTSLGILHTIDIARSTSTGYSLSPPIPGEMPSRVPGISANDARHPSSPASTKVVHWRVALEQVVLSTIAAEDEAQHHLQRHDRDINADEEELDNEDDVQASTLGEGSGSSGVCTTKRDCDFESEQQVKRSRSRSRSRSLSVTGSRSRSPTPIDSYHHMYESPELSTQSSLPRSNSASRNEEPQYSVSHPPPTRREVYALGMEPYPLEEYPLADHVLATDMLLLAPFLGRDLAVLTDADPRPTDPIVLAHVSSLFTNHGGNVVGARRRGAGSHESKEGQWSLIAQEVSQWVTMTLDNGRTELMIAELFVNEMRRVVKKRWRVPQWDSRVVYRARVVDSSKSTLTEI